MTADVSESNQRAWRGWLAGLDYRQDSELFAAERAILRDHTSQFEGKRILDIGVGTGRTTPALRAMASEYVGIDYSPEMVRIARQRFPDADFRQTDARDLSCFADASFGSVWFSFNGIDYVSHKDRLAVLGEIQRVLVGGGVFCFSTHNRDWSGLKSAVGDVPPLSWTGHPIKMSYRLLRYARAVRNRRRLGRFKVETKEYAIMNDPAHDFSLLLYCISLQEQVRQLRHAAFASVVALDHEGHELPLDKPFTMGSSIHLVAHKSG